MFMHVCSVELVRGKPCGVHVVDGSGSRSVAVGDEVGDFCSEMMRKRSPGGDGGSANESDFV